MFFRPKLRDLDIPEVSSDTAVVWSKEQIKAAARAQDSFVRQVNIQTPPKTGLDEALANADQLFNTAAAAIGATVVRHTWGLYKPAKGQTANYNGPRQRHPSLPKDYVLVAEVETVRPTQRWDPNHPDYDRVQQKCEELFYGESSSGYYLDDLYADQMVLGTTNDDQTPGLRLVDIEPRLWRRQS